MDEQARTKLVTAAMADDTDALERLLVHFYPILHSLVDARLSPALRPILDTDDVVQQAYVAAVKSAGTGVKFDSPAAFYAWLETITLNQLRDAERSARRQKRDVARRAAAGPAANTSYPDLIARATGRDSTPSRKLARHEATAAVLASLACLNDDQREVVRLRFLHDVPVSEIAQRMGKTETAVYTLCHRGLKALRARMESLTR